jgi:Flp pilus assembly protein TadB
VITIATSIVAPDHIVTLVQDPVGVRMVVGALALWAIGFVVIRRLIDVEY